MKTTIRRAAIVLMIMTLMTATAFAGTIQVNPTPEEKILVIGTETNNRISMEIDKAVLKGEAANNDAQLDAIMTNLQKKAAQISEVTIEKIERLGGEAICDLVEVNIGEETILVDPIRIVRLR